MPPLKYIADGFISDAKKLLDDFVKENSMEFTIFTNVWKKHHFSLIFMGRPTKKELNEFTNEIFHLTGKFLLSKSRIYQVGGIYLWYGLYLNQISEPPIRIRITVDQAKILMEIFDFAEEKEEKSLLFVLSYLFESAFEFVALPTLMGPFMRKDSEQSQESNNAVEFELDDGLLEIKHSGILKEISETLEEYSKLKRSPATKPIEEYKKYIKQLNDLLPVDDDNISTESYQTDLSMPGCSRSGIGSRRAQLKSATFSRSISSHQDSDWTEATDLDDSRETGEESSASQLIPGCSKSGIGYRRAQLKAAQFYRSSSSYQDSDWTEITDLDDPPETGGDTSVPQSVRTKIQHPRIRVPKQERKIGRPKKNSPEITISGNTDSEDGVVEFPTSDLFSKKTYRYEKVRRIRRYYEENPTESKK